MITSIDAGKKNILNLVKQFYQKQTTNTRLIGKTSVAFFKCSGSEPLLHIKVDWRD